MVIMSLAQHRELTRVATFNAMIVLKEEQIKRTNKSQVIASKLHQTKTRMEIT